MNRQEGVVRSCGGQRPLACAPLRQAPNGPRVPARAALRMRSINARLPRTHRCARRSCRRWRTACRDDRRSRESTGRHGAHPPTPMCAEHRHCVFAGPSRGRTHPHKAAAHTARPVRPIEVPRRLRAPTGKKPGSARDKRYQFRLRQNKLGNGRRRQVFTRNH
jgi:hypothetical protein